MFSNEKPSLQARTGCPTALALGTIVWLLAASCTGPTPLAGQGTRGTPPCSTRPPALRSGHYEYVVADTGIYIFAIDLGQRFVSHICLRQLRAGVRGVSASPARRVLYVSYGGDAGVHGTGSMLAYNLLTGRVLWTRDYAFGIDSMDITPDGRRIYMPTGELSDGGAWEVIDASTGQPVASLQGGKGPHNTLVSRDGRYVFLGSRNSNYLRVASTATNGVIRSIGLLVNGVRPFTINGDDTLAFTTATEFLGFQVSSIATSRVLYTVRFPGAVPTNPSAPSHGISLSPDERQLYVLDWVHDAVRVFDVHGLPQQAPKLLWIINLQGTFKGDESPCAYDCAKDGWLQHTRDGRFVYVGDAGDVIDTASHSTVARLAPLANTRKFLEIDWRNGMPVFATPREGIGYASVAGAPY